MRIIVAVNTFPKLSETFILNQITGLIDRGHDVRIWAREENDPDQLAHPVVEEYGLRDRIASNSISDSRPKRVFDTLARFAGTEEVSASKLAGLVNPLTFGVYGASLVLPNHYMAMAESGPADLVHAHFGPVGRTAAILKKAGSFNAPLVVSFHGFDVHAHLHRWGEDLYEDLFDAADCVTGNSIHVVEKVRELGASNILKHPMGLDPDKFEADFSQPSPSEPVELLTVARLTAKKGLKYSIRAVANLLDAGVDVRYRIIGEGAQRRELEDLISALGVTHRVALLGAKDRRNVAKAMNESHIFVLTSVTPFDGDLEGQGLVIQEAQASGLPVVTSWNGGIPEGVVPRQTALLSPPRDVASITENLRVLVESPERRVAMGKRGQEFVDDNFDIQDLNDRLVGIYEDVIRRSTEEPE